MVVHLNAKFSENYEIIYAGEDRTIQICWIFYIKMDRYRHGKMVSGQRVETNATADNEIDSRQLRVTCVGRC